MSGKLLKASRKRKRRIEARLAPRDWEEQAAPMLSGSNIHYEISDRTRAISVGGIGVIHNLVRRLGLADAINRKARVLKRHVPYWESDHVLNIAYNALCGGTCLEDIEHRRNDEAFLDCLGAQRIPDPTTEGDFCRRQSEESIHGLMDAFNESRRKVWKKQPEEFFEQAIIDADGTVVSTEGECKEGMDFNYHKKTWGYHPLLVSLANTSEPLYLANRSGNRPSSEDAAGYLDRAVDLVIGAGFRNVLLRGDTDFSQTKHLDGWHRRGVRFVFGMAAHEKLVQIADSLAEGTWKALEREPKYEVKTEERSCPERVKERIVEERGFRNLKLEEEHIAEFAYSPAACEEQYRIVALRKTLSVEQGGALLFPMTDYFFYITNADSMSTAEVVKSANQRCNQEKLIAQLKGLRALHSPVDTLLSNWAYMVMASLAWSLKAWYALMLPVTGRWQSKHEKEKSAVLRMSFRSFLEQFIRLPAQIIRAGRRIIFRLLSWNRSQHIFLRGLGALRRPALA